MFGVFNTKQQKILLTPKEMINKYPLPREEHDFILDSRNTIEEILTGKDKRFLIILGPCSIHNLNSAKEYARKVKKLEEKVSSHIFFVMRVYVEKPRSTVGWKGFLHDPYLNSTHDMNKGLSLARELFLELASIKVATAMEFLELMSANYLADLVSWGCIGARTSASQPHRQIASLLPMPVGFKNDIDGNISTAVEGALAAKRAHAFMNINEEGIISQVLSSGNRCPHIVLRGGGGRTNFDEESITYATSLLESNHLSKKLLIDCAHGNSFKNESLQKNVFKEVIGQMIEGNEAIVGTMLESHLFSGNQEHHKEIDPHYGISLTDPCINWQDTEDLVLYAYDQLQKVTVQATHV